MKKKMKLVVSLSMLLFLAYAPGNVSAALLTFTPAELSTWGINGWINGTVNRSLTTSPTDIIEGGFPGFVSGGYEFVGQFASTNSNLFAGVIIGPGSLLGPWDYSAYTGFGLSFKNTNQSDWSYQLWAFDGTNSEISPYLTLSPGNSGGIVMDWGTVDPSKITWFGFVVSSYLDSTGNNPSNPDTFHVLVSPVPEPGTMMLLGSGLVGLAGWGRKKFRK